MKIDPISDCYIPRLSATIDMMAIVSLWCVSLIIINPFGNFPLNDDWSYGLTVRHLIENGDFRPTGWTSMPLITQVLWGSLFCMPAGFSFNALRLSTLTLSLLGILGVYLIMRELRKPRWLAVVASLTLGFSPIYYALSNTFMTDVPYTAITIFASVFFLRSLRNGSDLPLLIGTTFAIAATLLRQLAISVPVAFAITFILKKEMTFRNILRAAIPPTLCIAALLVFQHWLEATGRLPALYHIKTKQFFLALLNPQTLLQFVNTTFVALLYLGWFLLPVLIFILASIWRIHRKKAIGFLTFSIGVILLSVMLKGHLLMPAAGNFIVKSGTGPVMLHDNYILHLNHIPSLPNGFWLAMTVISLLGAAFLIAVISFTAINLALRAKLWHAKMNDNEAAAIFLLLSAMIYLLPFLVNGFYDRYLVPAIPFLAAGIASVTPHAPRTKVCRFTVAIILAAFSFFAILGTRDYLAWNRVRWEALDDLMESRYAKASDIDGGFEFNGLYLYDSQYQKDPRKSWWWVQGDTILITFGRIPGYTVIKEYIYFHWMPPHVGEILVLRKNSEIRGAEHAEQVSQSDVETVPHRFP